MPRINSDIGKALRQVDIEFMRFGILAGVVATLAVVTQIGQLNDIAAIKAALPVDRREN